MATPYYRFAQDDAANLKQAKALLRQALAELEDAEPAQPLYAAEEAESLVVEALAHIQKIG